MKRSGSPRQLAVNLLLECFRKNQSLDRVFLSPDLERLDDRDRRFLKELVYGTLRQKLQLDYLIRELSNRPLNRIDDEILWILRVAIYQLRFLRVPNHAAVNEATGLCRHFEKSSASGFVNALLRSYLSNPPGLPAGDSPGALSIRYSHPEWLVKRYLSRYGKGEALSLMDRNNKPPESVLWVNPLKSEVEWFCEKLQQEGIIAQRVKGLPRAVVVQSENFVQHYLYRYGYCFFMDVNSQRIVELPDLNDRQWLGDLCAAPGNKSFVLTLRKAPGAHLISADASRRRIVEMKQRMEVYEIHDVLLMVQSLEAPAIARHLDWVLLDVPCSGLGTIRSNPDIRWKIKEEDLEAFHAKQMVYLHNGFRTLHEGGELLYSTCSTEPEENNQVIDRFLNEQPEGKRTAPDENWFSTALPGDGFYAARIRRL